jgi:hypothetical protein
MDYVDGVIPLDIDITQIKVLQPSVGEANFSIAANGLDFDMKQFQNSPLRGNIRFLDADDCFDML